MATMLARLERSEKRRRPSDSGLARRAAGLSEKYLDGRRCRGPCGGWRTRTAGGAGARRATARSGCRPGCRGCRRGWSTTCWCTSSRTCWCPATRRTSGRWWTTSPAERARGFLEGVAAAAHLGIEADRRTAPTRERLRWPPTTSEPTLSRLGPGERPLDHHAHVGVVGREPVDRPPAHVDRLLAHHRFGPGRRHPPEPYVEVADPPAGPQNATACASRWTGTGSSTSSVDAGLLGGLAQRRPGQRLVLPGSQWPPSWNHRPALRAASAAPAPGRPTAPGRWPSGGRGGSRAASRRRGPSGARRTAGAALLGGVGRRARRQRARASAWRRGHASVGRRGVRTVSPTRCEQVGQRGVELVVGQPRRRAPRPRGSRAGRPGRSAVGSRSGCAQTVSRASCPWRERSAPHSAEASRSRRGRSSSPTSAAKVASAGPPAARRRRTASCILAAAGIRLVVAWPTTSSTQPSTSASVVSSRASAASCAGRLRRLEQPALQRLLDGGRVGGVDAADRSSMPAVSMVMPRP